MKQSVELVQINPSAPLHSLLALLSPVSQQRATHPDLQNAAIGLVSMVNRALGNMGSKREIW
jgi:diadenosine tetraphosphate (Ap4A) HIT family hydrolase